MRGSDLARIRFLPRAALLVAVTAMALIAEDIATRAFPRFASPVHIARTVGPVGSAMAASHALPARGFVFSGIDKLTMKADAKEKSRKQGRGLANDEGARPPRRSPGRFRPGTGARSRRLSALKRPALAGEAMRKPYISCASSLR